MSLSIPGEILNYLECFTFSEQKNADIFSFSDEEKDPGMNRTEIQHLEIGEKKIPKFINEFWTSKQRQASSIHEVSYRACFKPQLPAFFIHLLTNEKAIIYDPFSGRGTTVIEAGLLGRNVIANDINPLSNILSYPRFFIPKKSQLHERLASITIDSDSRADIDLSMFYEKKTENEIVSLRNYLEDRKNCGNEDELDLWIRMVATNRLTGHSRGFFSVYTLPPNQAVTQESQRKINAKREQQPNYRDVKKIIMKKTENLIKDLTPKEVLSLKKSGEEGLFLNNDARRTEDIPNDSVQLIVTSPPFLDIVQYDTDNWLRCWFNSLDADEISSKLTILKSLNDWTSFMKECFTEFSRVIKPGGYVAFEVGEVRNGKVRLDEHIVPIGNDVGFECQGIVINSQEFTKTSNIWGIKNMEKGTNTNRIVLFKKPL